MAGEVIKTVLTADDTEHRAAFERAAAQVKRHQVSVEELRKKSLARATDEMRALKLEAAGQRDAANALRETLSLKERAIALAKQTGLSEQASTVLLQKRAALERQVAEQAIALAEQKRRAEAAAMQKGTLRGEFADLRALRLEAAGREEEARALRESTRLKERSATVARQTGLSEQAALLLLQKRAALERQIAERRKTGGGRGSAGSGLALLEASRGIEDAQYGIRGVLNNIPGLVLALGGTAGVAGALSLVAVAAAQLGPRLKNLFPDENKNLQDYLEALGRVREKVGKLADERGRIAADSFLRSLTAEETAIENQNIALGRSVELMRLQRDLAAERAGAADRLRKIELQNDNSLTKEQRERALKEVDAMAAKREADRKRAEIEHPYQDANKAAREAENADKRAKDDIERARAALKANEAELKKLNAQKTSGELSSASIEGARKRVQLLEKGINPGDVDVSGSVQEGIEKFKKAQAEARDTLQLLEDQAAGGGVPAKRIGELEGNITTLKAGLRELEERQKGLAEAAYDTAAARDHELRVMKQKLATHNALVASLEKERQIEIDREKRLAEEGKFRGPAGLRTFFESQRARMTPEQRAADEQRLKDALEARRRSQWDLKTRGGKSPEAIAADEQEAERKKRTKAARKDFTVEMEALRLERSGQKIRADALRKEHDLRKEAAEQAERMGLSEADMLRLLRHRERVEKDIIRNRENGYRGNSRIARARTDESRIRQSEQNLKRWKRLDSTGPTEGAIGRWGNRRSGLRDSAMDRQGRARAGAAKMTSEEKAAKYYADSLELMERQVKALERFQMK